MRAWPFRTAMNGGFGLVVAAMATLRGEAVRRCGMDWLVYLLAVLGIVAGVVVGFVVSGLWIIAIPEWRERR